MAICNPVIEPILGCGEGDLAIANLIARLFQTIVMVGGMALLLYLAWGGINWVTAGDDKGKVEAAKSRITNAVIGMIVLVATIAIALFLQFAFGFNVLDPSLDV